MCIRGLNMKFALRAAVAALAICAASPALALDPPVAACSLSLPTPDAIACQGYFAGNLLNGSPTDIANQQQAIANLPGPFTWNGNWSALESSTSPDLVITALDGNRLNFGTTLFGLTIIGAHFGNVDGPAGNVSVFWLFDFGTTGVTGVQLDNTQGFSNAALYTTGTPPPGVPEPATWALMLMGFGAAGYAIRRRRKFFLSQVA